MGAFVYQAVDQKGKQQKGVLEADSARQVRQQLREKGWMPLSVEQTSQKEKSAAGGFSLLNRSPKLSVPELALITRQLATLIAAGLPIDESLRALSDQTGKQRIKAMILAIRAKVLEGYTLAKALAAADLDGDGRLELIAGCSWYRRTSAGEWERHLFAEDYDGVRVVAADFDGDGRSEIAVAEVSLDIGQTYGRLAVFRPGSDVEMPWQPQLLETKLLGAHSLQVADFDGDGRPDLYVGEMGLGDWTQPHPPRQLAYLSRGDRGDFRMEEVVIDSGIGTHEAQAIELDGRVAILSKPYRALADTAPRPPEVDALYLYLPDSG